MFLGFFGCCWFWVFSFVLGIFCFVVSFWVVFGGFWGFFNVAFVLDFFVCLFVFFTSTHTLINSAQALVKVPHF